MLPAAIQAEILRLTYAEHWGPSQIARHLGIHRESVRKVARRRSVALTPAPPRPADHGRDAVPRADPGPAHRGPGAVRRDDLPGPPAGGLPGRDQRAPRGRAEAPPDAHPGGVRHADLRAGGSCAGRLGRVRRRLRDRPGQVHAFVLVLCYSRLLTVVFTFSQTLEAFLRCHEQAFAFVGGVVRECWYDNLATAVAERRGRLVRFHPRFLAYAGHHRFRPVACNVGRGNEKGRVEDAIKYLRTNFWPGRTFRDLADLNAQAQAWRDDLANTARAPGDAEDPRRSWWPRSGRTCSRSASRTTRTRCGASWCRRPSAWPSTGTATRCRGGSWGSRSRCGPMPRP